MNDYSIDVKVSEKSGLFLPKSSTIIQLAEGLNPIFGMDSKITKDNFDYASITLGVQNKKLNDVRVSFEGEKPTLVSYDRIPPEFVAGDDITVKIGVKDDKRGTLKINQVSKYEVQRYESNLVVGFIGENFSSIHGTICLPDDQAKFLLGIDDFDSLKNDWGKNLDFPNRVLKYLDEATLKERYLNMIMSEGVLQKLKKYDCFEKSNRIILDELYGAGKDPFSRAYLLLYDHTK